MKKHHYYLTILILLTSFSSSNSQSILAGVVSSNDYYEDIDPDFQISYHIGSIYDTDSVDLDLNKDGIDDIRFYTSHFGFGASNGWSDRTFAFCLHGNVKVVALIDTSYVCCPTPYYFFRMDTILLNTQIDSTMDFNNLGYFSAGIGGWSTGPTTSAWDNIGDRFIGVRIIESSDTLYGWIRAEYITTTSDPELTIKDYALNDGMFVGINPLLDEFSFKIYPNPAKDRIMVTMTEGTGIGQLTLCDVRGKTYTLNTVSNRSGSFQTQTYDISGLASGVYFLKIEGKETYVTKVVKY